MTSDERKELERDGGERICELRHAELAKQLDLMWLNVNSRFDAQDEKSNTAMMVAKEAVDKAEKLATTRAQQQNEWRSTVNDIMGNMLTRDAYDRGHVALAEKHEELARRVSQNEALNIGMKRTIAYLITGVSISIVVVTFVMQFVAK